MNGYLEAGKVVDKMLSLIKVDKVTKENAKEWLKFTRTIISTAQILETRAFELLGIKTN